MSIAHLNITNNDSQNTAKYKLDILHQQNTSYLHLFKSDIAGLAPKTIKRHLQNMDFFLNTYLVFDEAHPLAMEDGVNTIDDFLSYFLENKIYFADSTKRSFVTSLRNFINLCLFMVKSLLSNMRMWWSLCVMVVLSMRSCWSICTSKL